MKAKFALLFAAVLVMITRQADSQLIAPTLSAVISPAVAVSTTNVEVDAGITVTFTCAKGATGDTPTSFEFYEGTNKLVTKAADGVTVKTTSPWTYTQVTALANNDQVITCQAIKSGQANTKSTGLTLKVTAIPKPTLTSVPAVTTTDPISTICLSAVGSTVKFTCAKATGAKQAPVKFTLLGVTGTTPTGGPPTWTTAAIVASNIGNVVTCEHWNSDTLKTASTSIKILLTPNCLPEKPTVTGFKAVPKEKESMTLTCVKKSGSSIAADKEFKWYQTMVGAAQTDVLSSLTSGTLKANYTFTVKKDHKDNSFCCRAQNAQGLSVLSDCHKITSVTDVAATQVISLLTMLFALAVSATFRD